MSDNKNKALTLEERNIIEKGICSGAKKTDIARTIGKDNSTVGKEIKAHRYCASKCNMPLECSAYKKCGFGRKCTPKCPGYIKFRCPRRDRSPGACNGCSRRSSCRFDKLIYDPARAEREYRTTLVDSRLGVNLTTSEAKAIASVVGPLLKQGLSPYRIVTAHPEIGISEKTLYNYIENGVLEISDIGNLDLRRKVSRKLPKSAGKKYKKREDRSFLKGRLYENYREYMAENPDAKVLQMDTVYNDGTNGPFLQTFKFIGTGIMIAVYHDTKTAQDMVEGLDTVEQSLGQPLFNKWAEVLLTDRGSEFSSAEKMELRPDGTRRTRVFYCDPMQSGQKGSLEVNHEQLRYIFPKGTDLRANGLTGQAPLNLALSHINSAPVKSLNGKSPIEFTRFLEPELWEKLAAFGLTEIPKDKIVLKEYLLKNQKKS